jgi:molybdopterin adenylyltransferase
MIRTAILTVSDRSAAGRREDRSVQALREVLATGPLRRGRLPGGARRAGDHPLALRILTEGEGVDLVLTTGGTGLALRDRTPEATLEVVERTVPGLAEAMRAAGAREDPRAWLSRAVVGVRRATLVVNLPGSPAGRAASLAAIAASCRTRSTSSRVAAGGRGGRSPAAPDDLARLRRRSRWSGMGAGRPRPLAIAAVGVVLPVLPGVPVALLATVLAGVG